MLLVAGCASVPSPNPAPDITPTTTTPSRPTTSVAAAAPPAVTVAACDVLTPTQVQDLGLDPETATPTDVEGQRLCSWSAAPDARDPGSPLIVAVYASGGGFAGVQAVPGLPGGSVEQTEIDGYPASVIDTGGFCSVAVVLDAATLVVTGGGADCEATRTITRAALGNLA